MRKVYTIVLVMFLCGTMLAQQVRLANEVFGAASMQTSSSGYQADWTIGEPFTATAKIDNSTLIQGFHQGTYVLTVAGIETHRALINIKTFPNPVIDELNVEVTKAELSNYPVILIYNFQGQLLIKDEIVSTNYKVDMSHFKSQGYLLQVFMNNEPVKTVTIIKQ